MSDVTISADVAKEIASRLRIHGAGHRKLDGNPDVRYYELADILDPPAPSLWDDMVQTQKDVYLNWGGTAYAYSKMTAALLAVVRRHVEGLDSDVGPNPDDVVTVNRDDVLRLLGGTDE